MATATSGLSTIQRLYVLQSDFIQFLEHAEQGEDLDRGELKAIKGALRECEQLLSLVDTDYTGDPAVLETFSGIAHEVTDQLKPKKRKPVVSKKRL